MNWFSKLLTSFLARLARRAPVQSKAGLTADGRRCTQINWEGAQPTPDWTALDVGQLRLFLSSGVGAKLMARGRALASHTAVQACGDSMTTLHSAGRAAGLSDALNWMASLASAETEQKILSRAAGDQAANHPENLH